MSIPSPKNADTVTVKFYVAGHAAGRGEPITTQSQITSWRSGVFHPVATGSTIATYTSPGPLLSYNFVRLRQVGADDVEIAFAYDRMSGKLANTPTFSTGPKLVFITDVSIFDLLSKENPSQNQLLGDLIRSISTSTNPEANPIELTIAFTADYHAVITKVSLEKINEDLAKKITSKRTYFGPSAMSCEASYAL